MTKFNDNPEYIFSNIISMLKKGVKDRKHGFHCPTFSNISKNKNINSRVVVLRKFDSINLRLNFHTDYRSKKILEIKKNSNSFFVFYDYKEKIQLRIKTISSIHHKDDIALHAWKKTKLPSRKCYLSTKAPSSKTHLAEDSIPNHLIGIDPKKEESEIGYNNFTVVSNKIQNIDWLNLSFSGHRRLRIVINPRNIKYSWLIP